MDTRLSRRFLVLVLTAFGLGVTGCQIIPEAKVDPTRFYVLNGLPTVPSGVIPVEGRLQVGLRPVEVPEYLRRTRSLVVRQGDNQVRLQEDARWAETLDGGVNRVLRDRLLAASKVAGVYSHPFPGAIRRDYDVAIRLLRCEGAVAADGRTVARFAAAYEIVAGDASGEVLVRRVFAAEDRTWDGRDYGQLAQLLSQAAQELSEAIANDLPSAKP